MSELKYTQFTISYDAEGDLAAHTIDAKALGNAILGMDDLIKASAKIVSNGSSEAALKVITPAQDGSLEVVFAILSDPTTTKAIMTTLGIATTGIAVGTATAFSAIERIKDRKIQRITVDTKTKMATIEVDGEKIEAPDKVAQLVSDRTVRDALNKVIKAPFQGRENAKLKFINSDSQIELTLLPEEIKFFEPLKTGSLEEVSIQSKQVVASFTKLNFKGRKGWRIATRDGLECGVSIRDDIFMQKISANEEAFLKDKLYTIELEHTQTKNPGRTRNSYTIKRVINELSPD